MRETAFLVLLALSIGAAVLRAGESDGMKLLLDFEEGADLEALKAHSENIALDIVQDNGVTSGKNCCRLVGNAGSGYSVMELHGALLKGFDQYEYFAIDLFTERTDKIHFVMELWDGDSKNYATRCTYENLQTRPGQQTLLWKIDQPKRNGKEGLDWDELQPKDKIRRDALSKVKLFFVPPKEGGNTVFWIDKVRLMKADAVGGTIKVALPASAKAFDFGSAGAASPGWTAVDAKHAGVMGTNVRDAGRDWPDPLTGGGLEADGAFTFTADVPDGQYHAWLCAAPVLSEATRKQPFRLKLCEQLLRNDTLTTEQYYGEQGIFRHLRTQYSQREHAQWLDYVLPAFPEFTAQVEVKGGRLVLEASNYRIGALLLLPAAEEGAFKSLGAELRAARLTYFYKNIFLDPHEAPKAAAGDGAYVLWEPNDTDAIRPWSAPSEAARKASSVKLQAAAGRRVVARVCVTAFEDLGSGDVALSDLSGPGTIPASAARLYHQNYVVRGTSVDEQMLLPWTKIRFEPGITWAYWVWLAVPADAKPGAYKGTLSFKPEKGGAKSLPVELTVHAFKLVEDVPASFGMYYAPWNFPEGFDRRKLLKEQFVFKREIGFTASSFGSGSVKSLKPDGKVVVTFDPLLPELIKEVGMGRTPEQMQMGQSLGMARQIARLLGLRPAVDHNPGIEFTKPELKGYYQDALRQYKAFIESTGLPVAVETVDEPREVPNPWNRNLEHTNTYGDWMEEVGLNSFVTPMGDMQSGKDYTTLTEHHRIVSVHAWEASRRMIAATREHKKTLWFYNTGMDRVSWGFYNWKMESKGRWEWHFCWQDRKSPEGYPAENEWYSPFGSQDGFALHAPYANFAGGMLFKSNYLQVAKGIEDYAYLTTLERVLAQKRTDAAKAETVKAADEFLAALKKSIPEFPKVKGLASPDAGALVGEGMDASVGELCGPWQIKCAELIGKLAP